MISFPAVNSANSVVVDANVIINLMNSDPLGLSLDLLKVEGKTTYITDTVEQELFNNLSGEKYAVYVAWAFNNHASGEVILVPTGIPTGGNQGEASIAWAVQNGFAGDGPHLILTGDVDAQDLFGGSNSSNVANSMEFANSLLLSGEITLARYIALTAQLTAVAPHEVVGENGANYAFVPGSPAVEVNGVEIRVLVNGLMVNGEFVGLLQKFEIDPQTGTVTVDGPENCFSADTLIQMWPLEQPIDSSDRKIVNQHVIADNAWAKPIEEVSAGDWVVAFDSEGHLVPGKVIRTMINSVNIVLDFFGTGVTPGHVYYRADSHKPHKFETLIDILREDGALQKTDGSVIRASTGAEIGGPLDDLVSVVIGEVGTDGDVIVSSASKLRAGHRVIMDDGSEFTLAQIIEAGGGSLLENGLVVTEANPEGVPFHWVFGEELPKPEGYVLRKSGVTLEDIYRANEWEDMRPKLPAPLSVRTPAVDQIQ